VQYHDGDWYVGDSRVEVYGVIAAWQRGFSPADVQNSLPVLSLVDAYGTVLYYLEHRDEMDAFFHTVDTLYRERNAEAEARDPDFYALMRERFAAFRRAQEQREETRRPHEC
jgi:hypothetical protein